MTTTKYLFATILTTSHSTFTLNNDILKHAQKYQHAIPHLPKRTVRELRQEMKNTMYDAGVFDKVEISQGEIVDQDPHVHYEMVRFLGKGEYGTVWEAYRCSTPGHDMTQDWLKSQDGGSVSSKSSEHERSKHVCDRYNTVAVKLLTNLDKIDAFKKVFPLADEWAVNKHLVKYALNNSISFTDLGVLPLLSFFQTSKYTVLVFPKGTPTRKGQTFTLNRIQCMSRDLLISLHHLQQAQITHRDIKPNNVFGWQGRFFLGDLSFSVKSSRKQTDSIVFKTFVMSQQTSWMRRFGPEFSQGFARRSEMDMWALGCSLYEMVFDDFLVYPGKSDKSSSRLPMAEEQERVAMVIIFILFLQVF